MHMFKKAVDVLLGQPEVVAANAREVRFASGISCFQEPLKMVRLLWSQLEPSGHCGDKSPWEPAESRRM